MNGTARTGIIRDVHTCGRAALARRVSVQVRVALPDTLPDGLTSDLSTIARRGTRCLFVFSRGDKGLAYFEQHVPQTFLNGVVGDVVSHVVVDGAGHAFRPRGAQDRLVQIATEFVMKQVSGVPEVPGVPGVPEVPLVQRAR